MTTPAFISALKSDRCNHYLNKYIRNPLETRQPSVLS